MVQWTDCQSAEPEQNNVEKMGDLLSYLQIHFGTTNPKTMRYHGAVIGYLLLDPAPTELFPCRHVKGRFKAASMICTKSSSSFGSIGRTPILSIHSGGKTPAAVTRNQATILAVHGNQISIILAATDT